jgi:hypothetical protein
MLARWPKPGLRLRAAAGAAVTAHCCWCCSTQSRSARTCHGPLHVMSAAVLVYVSVGHARAECMLLLRRLHRRVACYWPAAGRCRPVGSPRSAGGTWLAAHFAGANNSNHPHSAAPFGKGPTIWEGAPGRFGEGLGRMRANVTSGCRRALQRAAAGGRVGEVLSPSPWPRPSKSQSQSQSQPRSMTAPARGWLARAWSSLHHTAPSGRLGPAGRAEDGALLGRTGCGRPVTPWVLTRRQAGRTQERASRDQGSRAETRAAEQRQGQQGQ